jgi:hypothetical protein
MSACAGVVMLLPPLFLVIFFLHIYRKQRSGHAGL